MKKQVISSRKAPTAIGPYSQAVSANGLVFVSGQLPLNAETGELAVGAEVQAEQTLLNIREILSAAGLSMDNVVKCTIFLKNMEDFAVVNQVYAAFFGRPCPARSCVEVAALPKGALIEIDAIAVVNGHAE